MMLRYRITPWGFIAFVRTAFAQHKHLHSPWPRAIAVAWQHGPIR